LNNLLLQECKKIAHEDIEKKLKSSSKFIIDFLKYWLAAKKAHFWQK
jgi:hypothetical protein